MTQTKSEPSPMHQQISGVGPPYNIWEFHDSGDTMEVRNVTTLAYYALDDLTGYVTHFPELKPGAEIRVYGPDGKIITYEFPTHITPESYKILWGLVVELKKMKRIKKG